MASTVEMTEQEGVTGNASDIFGRCPVGISDETATILIGFSMVFLSPSKQIQR
jgi:hypothetical protein